MRRLFLWLSSVPVLLSLGSCAVNPVSGKRRTTCRDLAKRSPLGPDAESVLRLSNGDWPAGEPGRRHTVKLVR